MRTGSVGVVTSTALQFVIYTPEAPASVERSAAVECRTPTLINYEGSLVSMDEPSLESIIIGRLRICHRQVCHQ